LKSGWNRQVFPAALILMKVLPLILRFSLCAAYVAVGTYVLAWQLLPSGIFNWFFGLACIVYGIFRAVRAYQAFCADRENDDYDE
jgi:hypothetical protein